MPARSPYRTSVRGAAAVSLLLSTALTANAQIVPDGSTGTVVNLGRDGAVTVGIAPSSRSGVSLNRYEKFNVAKPGVRLDNREEAARTIVSEVTSTERSTIAGPLEVLGQRAHVIVANPNGIVLDGARFVNTGRVAITTGRITLDDRQIAPGVFQENAVATVSGGAIEIGNGGLAGQMDAVDLIAHQVKVAGPVANEDVREGASLSLVAGKTRTEFDSSVLPGNASALWSRTTPVEGSKEASVLVEITRGGVLQANRIGIEVNGAGAGVRFAGSGRAGSRGFSLRSDGQVVIDGGRIDAGKDGGIFLTADSIELRKAALSGATIAASTRKRFDSAESTLTAVENQDGPGIISIETGDGFADSGGVYASTGQSLFRSGSGLSFSGSDVRSGTAIFVTAKDALSVTDARLRARAHVVGQAGALRFTGHARQSEVVAEGGSLILSSRGNLENRGALLQGGTKTKDLEAPDGTEAAGAVTIRARGDIINQSKDQLAVAFGAAGDVVVNAGRALDNLQGRFLANGEINLTVGTTLRNGFVLPNGQRDPIVTQSRHSGKRVWWTLGLRRERHYRLSYDFGTLQKPEWLGLVTGTKGVNVSAGTQMLNEGGVIGSSSGDITLKSPIIETANIGSGRVDLRRVCVITCSYQGSGEVLSYGGRIESGQDLFIEASNRVLNDGGTIYAGRNVVIDTDALDVRSGRVPVVVMRPRGLYNFWSSKAAWVFLREQYGQIVADTGKLTVHSKAPARLQGGQLVAGEGLDLAAGQEIVAPPAGARYAPDAIGLMRGLPFLKP